MSVLSIQSAVCYGHVGNSAAVFSLQRLGLDVMPVTTVLYSSHPGYRGWRGQPVSAAHIAELIDGLACLPSEEGAGLAGARAVLTGYFGAADQIEVAADAVDRVRAFNAGAIYCCDPVIGDRPKGRYVSEGVAEQIVERLLPRADILVPNHFELDLLAGVRSQTLDEVVGALRAVQSMGPKIVVVTSVHLADTADDRIEIVAADGAQVWRVTTPLLPIAPHGGGDIFAALFLGRYLRHHDVGIALSHSVSATYAIIEHTAAIRAREPALIAAQDHIVAPTARFQAERVR